MVLQLVPPVPCLPRSTIVTVMMGTASAIFNPAVLFGWAILGRVTWGHWITLSLTQVGRGREGARGQEGGGRSIREGGWEELVQT